MDFGRLDSVDDVDFSLPADPSVNQAPRDATARLSLGVPVFAKREWIGKVYPPTTTPPEMLRAYAEQFDILELNSTYYALPEDNLLQRWLDQTPEHFRFCPKVLRDLSPPRSPERVAEGVAVYLNGMELLHPRVGTYFWQLKPSVGPESWPLLKGFFDAWSDDIPLCVELRHPGWFADAKVRDQLLERLDKAGVGAVISDTSGRRDVLHMGTPSGLALVRFAGHHLHSTDYTRLDAWAERLRGWLSARTVRQVYFIVHQPHELLAAKLADYAAEKFGAFAPEVRRLTFHDPPEQLGLFR